MAACHRFLLSLIPEIRMRQGNGLQSRVSGFLSFLTRDERLQNASTCAFKFVELSA